VPAPGTSTVDQSGGRVTSAWAALGQSQVTPAREKSRGQIQPAQKLTCLVLLFLGFGPAQMQPAQELTCFYVFFFFFFFFLSGFFFFFFFFFFCGGGGGFFFFFFFFFKIFFFFLLIFIKFIYFAVKNIINYMRK